MAKDFKAMNAYLNNLSKKAPGLMEEIVKKTALVVDAEAKKRCPVDTGNLRASITFELNGTEAEVGTNVEYAPFVEYGTSKSKAQPFMTPAKEKGEKDLEKIISREVKKYVGD